MVSPRLTVTNRMRNPGTPGRGRQRAPAPGFLLLPAASRISVKREIAGSRAGNGSRQRQPMLNYLLAYYFGYRRFQVARKRFATVIERESVQCRVGFC